MLNVIDIQINASFLSEGTTLSLLEGMSLGIPMVATKCGGNPYIIENGKNGVLVEKADSNSLANGVLRIAQDKNKYNEMKETSKEIFKQKYTSKIYAGNIEKIYESMVK
jgi:glycosyltransferase involved in cell wall biosynthesis